MPKKLPNVIDTFHCPSLSHIQATWNSANPIRTLTLISTPKVIFDHPKVGDTVKPQNLIIPEIDPLALTTPAKTSRLTRPYTVIETSTPPVAFAIEIIKPMCPPIFTGPMVLVP